MSRKVPVAAVMVVFSLIGFFLFEGLREQKILLEDATRKEVETLATVLRASLEDPALWQRPETLRRFSDRFAAIQTDGQISRTLASRPSEGFDILILRSDRTVFAGSSQQEEGKTYARDPSGEVALTVRDGKLREFMEVGHAPAHRVVVPLDVDHVRKGVLLFRSPSAAAAGRAHDMVVWVSREAFLIAIPALLLIIWMTRRYLLEPIRLLREGADAWKRGEFSHRVSFPGGDELGQLRDGFNEMATAIQTQHDTLELKQSQLEDSLRRNREAQAQLVQSEKLASIGTLAAGIAHELNQPLMLIRGYAQRLLSGRNGLTTGVPKEIEIIHEETSRMATIIRHLKDFSRKSAGERKEVDLNTIIQKSCALLSEDLRRHRIEVRLILDPNLPLVWADPVQLTQIFVNLITNARDALDGVGGGTLLVQSGLREDRVVEVSFTDTGPGIDAEILPRIFDPFFTTKDVGAGTGLGLSIALGLAQAHGGELTVTSEPGHGACFAVSLPPGGNTHDGTGSNPRR